MFAVASHWKKWDNRLVLLLIPGAVAGMLVGTLFIANISPNTLRKGLGVIIILFVIYKLLEGKIIKSMAYTPRHWHGLLGGSIAGFT